jgi:hypothetical protein
MKRGKDNKKVDQEEDPECEEGEKERKKQDMKKCGRGRLA